MIYKLTRQTFRLYRQNEVQNLACYRHGYFLTQILPHSLVQFHPRIFHISPNSIQRTFHSFYILKTAAGIFPCEVWEYKGRFGLKMTLYSHCKNLFIPLLRGFLGPVSSDMSTDRLARMVMESSEIENLLDFLLNS